MSPKGFAVKAAKAVGGAAAAASVAGFGLTLVVLAAFMWRLLPEMVRGAVAFEDGTPLFIIWPYLIAFARLEGWLFGVWVCVVATGLTVCIAWLVIIDWRKIRSDAARFFRDGGAVRLPKSGLVGVLAAFLAVGAFDLAYAAFLTLVGGDLGDPLSGIDEFWRVSYLLANASIWEEIVGRVMLIGFPLLLLDLAYGRPGAVKRLWGKYDRLDASFWILAVYSSILFGVAHAGGWTWWKVPPTLFAGVFFAWLYGKYGLHAAVTLHFAFDYLSIPYLLIEGADFTGWSYVVLLGYLAFGAFVSLGAFSIVWGLALEWLDVGKSGADG